MWTYSCIGCVLYHVLYHLLFMICFEHLTTIYDSPYYFHCSVWGVINIVFFNLILGLMALSHVRAMTCDPGMVSTLQNNQPDFALIQTDKYKQQVCKSPYYIVWQLKWQNSILSVSIWYLYKNDRRIHAQKRGVNNPFLHNRCYCQLIGLLCVRCNELSSLMWGYGIVRQWYPVLKGPRNTKLQRLDFHLPLYSIYPTISTEGVGNTNMFSTVLTVGLKEGVILILACKDKQKTLPLLP